MTPYRRRRGAETQRIVAHAWRQHGWPHAEPVGAGAPGRDLTGTPGVAVEIKARRDFDPAEWLRQAGRHRRYRDVAVVVLRLDGSGAADVARWPVIVDQATLWRLLNEAGYGSPPEQQPS